MFWVFVGIRVVAVMKRQNWFGHEGYLMDLRL